MGGWSVDSTSQSLCVCASDDVGCFLSVFLHVYTLLLITITMRPCRQHCPISSSLDQQCVRVCQICHMRQLTFCNVRSLVEECMPIYRYVIAFNVASIHLRMIAHWTVDLPGETIPIIPWLNIQIQFFQRIPAPGTSLALMPPTLTTGNY